MTWLELVIKTDTHLVDELSDLLTELGALAVTSQDAADQPIYEPLPGTIPLWDKIILTGLFEENCDLETIRNTIATYFPKLVISVKPLANQEWERAWMKDFQPMKFGKRLWIIPSFHTTTPKPFEVILDPGLAFGTGKHPTTSLCLQWLDQNIHGGEEVIDYGCGSGILAIAAIKLGAKKAYAIDYDPQAMLATNENAKQNGLTEKEVITFFPQDFKPKPVDILIANILANPIMELAEVFSTLLHPEGRIVLSGILHSQAEAVLAKYKPWFKMTKIDQLEDWVRLEGYKFV